MNILVLKAPHYNTFPSTWNIGTAKTCAFKIHLALIFQ